MQVLPKDAGRHFFVASIVKIAGEKNLICLNEDGKCSMLRRRESRTKK